MSRFFPIVRLTTTALLMAGSVVRSTELPEMTFFTIDNIAAVISAPTESSVFTTGREWRITKITTYHWNNGSGATPGTIALEEEGGTVYGPWSTTGRSGQGGSPNVYWDAMPDILLPPGNYTIVDSDPATWSQNTESGERGFVIVNGHAQLDPPSGGALIASILYAIEEDLRITPVVWTAETPEGLVETQIAISAADLRTGANRLTFGAGAEGETETGPWVTVQVRRLPFINYKIASIVYAIEGDPRITPVVWTAETPEGLVEAQMEISSADLRTGTNRLTFGAAGEGATETGLWVTTPVRRLPFDNYDTGSVAIAVNKDPAESADISQTVQSPSHLADLSLTLPSGLARSGLNHLQIRTRNSEGEWGPMLITPFLQAPDPALQIAEIAMSVNKDPAEEADKSQLINPNLTLINLDLNLANNFLTRGAQKLYLRVRDDSGNWGPLLLIPLLQTPDVELKVSEIAMSVNRDPMDTADVNQIINPETSLANVSLDLPQDSVPDGIQKLFVRARDESGNWGPLLVSPLVGEIPNGAVFQIQLQVLDEDGMPQNEAVTTLATVPSLPLETTATIPPIQLRFSGDYVIQAAAIMQNGLPGPLLETAFQQMVTPFREMMNLTFWPPEDYAQMDLSFSGDVNQDGVANGTAFSLGSDSMSFVADRLPFPWSEGEALILTFRQRSGGIGTPGMGYEVDGIRYTIEYSEDLAAPWQDAAGVAETVGLPVENSDGTETVSIRIEKPPASPALFARLRITLLL